jgi:hypothetical protein
MRPLKRAFSIVALLFLPITHPAFPQQWQLADFAIPLHEILLSPAQIFVGSGYTTVCPLAGTVAGVGSFFSPPFAASNFSMKVKLVINGKPIDDTGQWGGGYDGLLYANGVWQPDRIVRTGFYHRQVDQRLVSFRITTELIPLYGRAGFLLKYTLHNRTPESLRVQVTPGVQPGSVLVQPLHAWGFFPPVAPEEAVAVSSGDWAGKSAHLQIIQQAEAFRVAGLGTHTTYVAGVLTEKAPPREEPLDPASLEEATTAAWNHRLARYTQHLPRLKTTIPGLEAFYRRSLVRGLVSIWEMPDFVVNPYLATAGMDGGAMNCYLWDIGYAPNILALMLGKGLQPIARQLANVKLDQFYSFTPSGEGIGVPYSYSVWAFTNVVWALARHQGADEKLYAEAKRLILDQEQRPQRNHLVDFGNQHNLQTKAERRGQQLVLSLQKPGQIIVEVNGDRYNSLALFANPPEKQRPSAKDTNVIYFGPGLHRIGNGLGDSSNVLKIKSGQTLYLAGGAFVQGAIQAENASNIRIAGRGIFDGSLMEHDTKKDRNKLFRFYQVRKAEVEGIILRDSPHHGFLITNTTDAVFSNLKTSAIMKIRMASYWAKKATPNVYRSMRTSCSGISTC